MRSSRRHGISLVALATAVGCGWTSASSSFETGTFSYLCSSDGDPHCDVQAGSDVLPAAVARGSRFELRFNGHAGVKAVSTRVVREIPYAEFETLVAGNVGFVAMSGEDAVDALRVMVAEPDGLAIAAPNVERSGWSRWSAGSEQVLGLGKRRLRASGLVGSSSLAGTLTGLTWTLDPPDVATIAEDDGIWQLSTRKPGSATLRVTRGEVTSVVRLVVKDEPIGGMGDGGLGDGGDADAGVDGGDS